MDTSATGLPSDVLPRVVLFAAFGSLTPLVTLTGLRMGSAPAYPGGTVKVAVTVAVAPDVSAHPGDTAHAPTRLTSVRPGGVGSLTSTFVASEGPTFFTVI